MDTRFNERPNDILSPSDAARCVGLAVSTLGKLRCWGGGPEFLKLGRKVAYRRAALDEWLAARVARNTSDAARLPARLTEAR
jgi:predicted DNA-binding transcriptional regulator AlpA